MDLHSVMPVRAVAASLPWFEALFGRRADEIIGGEYLWQVGENAWIVLDLPRDRRVRVTVGTARRT